MSKTIINTNKNLNELVQATKKAKNLDKLVRLLATNKEANQPSQTSNYSLYKENYQRFPLKLQQRDNQLKISKKNLNCRKDLFQFQDNLKF